MSDKQYTAAEVRTAFMNGVRWRQSEEVSEFHETRDYLDSARVEVLRRYPDKEDQRPHCVCCDVYPRPGFVTCEEHSAQEEAGRAELARAARRRRDDAHTRRDRQDGVVERLHSRSLRRHGNYVEG
jgi:hypothetical protein